MSTKRRQRSVEELHALLASDPELRDLYECLRAEQGVEVEPDGTGDCVLKVYMRGEKESYQGFLRVFTPIDKSYVQWRHVPVVHAPFAHLVRSSDGDDRDGSYVKSGTTVAQLVTAVAEAVRLHQSRAR